MLQCSGVASSYGTIIISPVNYVALSLGPDPKDELACKPIRRYIDCKSIKNVCFLVQLQVRSAVIVERHADQMTYFRKP